MPVRAKRSGPRRALARTIAVALVVSSISSGAARAEVVGQRVAGELRKAVAFTFDDRGRLWVVEKDAGAIQIANVDSGRHHRFFHVPHVVGQVEQGLVGIALHPNFPEAAWVYVFATRSVGGRLVDQVLRIRSVHGVGKRMQVLVSAPASSQHAHSGGRILFGPDEMLYAVMGDAMSPSAAQSPGSLRGKVLRMTPWGAVPDDNPTPGSRVYVRGIRNSFGLAFDPGSRRLWETENGPECNDELNRLRPGRNFGWGPSATCAGTAPGNTNQDGPRPVMPERWFTPTIAPTGIAFCDGCRLGPMSEGAALFGDYNGGRLWRARLSADRMRVVRLDTLAEPSGSILSVEVGPHGRLYYSTYTGVFRLVRRR